MELEQQKKFDRLVRQLERSPDRHKYTNYRLKVAAIAAIGYGYIAAIFIGSIGSIWLLEWLVKVAQLPIRIEIASTLLANPQQLATVGIVLALLIISMFWTTPLQLTDRQIERHEFPQLFALIDELSHKLKAPKIDRVVINYEHNAAVVQLPHWDLLKTYQNYLILGLPLMQSLTVAQFTATLAHELGHLSNRDSSFAGYILRIRQLCEQLAIDSNLFIFNRFFRWYEPLIKAYSFISLREGEYAADALAQQLTSPEIAASDLIQTYIYQHFLQECFSKELDRQARRSPTPPADVVTQMLAALRQPLDPQLAKVWLGLLLGQATDTDDTHPCLSDRLAAVSERIPRDWQPQPMTQTAAEYFFGDRLVDLASELDRSWYEDRQEIWLQQYQHSRLQQAHLTALELHSQTASLSPTDAANRAFLTGELQGEAAALPLWAEILDRDPRHAQANFYVGKAKLAHDDVRGCNCLERAIAGDPDLIVYSCEELYRFYNLCGDSSRAEIYLEWRQQHLHKQWRSKLERNLTNTDRLIPHDLDGELIAEIQRKLSQYSLVTRAYLVCKPMQIFQDRPLYVLGLKIASNRGQIPIEPQVERELCDRLQIELNFGNRLLIAMFDSDRSLATDRHELKLIEKIQKIPDACIF